MKKYTTWYLYPSLLIELLRAAKNAFLPNDVDIFKTVLRWKKEAQKVTLIDPLSKDFTIYRSNFDKEKLSSEITGCIDKNMSGKYNKFVQIYMTNLPQAHK